MRSESARKARIKEIASQIAEISDELKNLILEDERATSTSGTTSAREASTRASSGSSRFRIGDRIVITNNYIGHFGRTGTVTVVDEENGWVHFHQDTPH